MARDLGAALGDINAISPRKNHPDSFETNAVSARHQQRLTSQFAYFGLVQEPGRDRITPEEVVWASDLLGRLSDQQWADAFRAGGYEPAVANRFIAKLKEKVEQGRALGTRAADRDQQ